MRQGHASVDNNGLFKSKFHIVLVVVLVLETNRPDIENEDETSGFK